MLHARESGSRLWQATDAQFFYLARVRSRRFHSQVTHVLVRCIVCADETISLAQRSDHQWDFQTVWTVAKSLLGLGWQKIRTLLVDHDNEENGSVYPMLSDKPDFVDVWPGIVKRTKKTQDERPIDFGDVPTKPAAKRKPGLKKIPPTSTVLLDSGEVVAPRPRRRRNDVVGGGGPPDGPLPPDPLPPLPPELVCNDS